MSLARLRPATREERQLAGLWFAAAASVIALRQIWIAVAPWLRPCTFRSLTGVPCPTCGTTRTALALLDLDLGAALAANPLAALAGLAFLAGGVLALPWLVLVARVPILPRLEPRRVAWLLAALAAVNWVYLIVSE